MLLAVDGRWPLPEASMRGLLADAQGPSAAGAAWFGGGVATAHGEPFALDFASLDLGAARALDATGALDPPAPGEIALNGTWARANGLAAGDALALRASTFPKPLVTAGYEMERIRPCDRTPTATVCFLPPEGGQLAIRLAVPPDSQDLAFIPEGAELGPGGLPAWWNGSFESPSGERTPWNATLDELARPTLATVDGPIAPGAWTIRFRLESNKTTLNGAAAGIVRVREPGYTWFDDRLVVEPDGPAQTRELLSWGRDEQATLRVSRLVERAIPAGVALLTPADAQRLTGARADEASGLVVVASPALLPALSDARNRSADAVALGLRARPAPQGPGPAPAAKGALLFRAPLDVDVAKLPPVPGLAAPSLAAMLETPVGEIAAAESRPVPGLRLLAFGGPGDPPWSMPPGGRWPSAQAALDNVTRSRTLVLSTPDWAPGTLLTTRLVLGDDRVGRVAVAVESVEGGPADVAWSSASLVAGAGKPLGAVVVAPLAPGADARAAAAQAQQAWGPLGLALDAGSIA